MDKNQNKALSLVTPSSVYITKREFPRKKLLHSSRMPSKVSLCLWKTYTAIFTSSLCLKKSITFLLKESKFLTSRIKKKKKKRDLMKSQKKKPSVWTCVRELKSLSKLITGSESSHILVLEVGRFYFTMFFCIFVPLPKFHANEP